MWLQRPCCRMTHFGHCCRSRTRNMLWYGVLGGREMLNRTYRNLEQRVLLECDGQQICLPSLQGIVVMNITRYVFAMSWYWVLVIQSQPTVNRYHEHY